MDDLIFCCSNMMCCFHLHFEPLRSMYTVLQSSSSSLQTNFKGAYHFIHPSVEMLCCQANDSNLALDCWALHPNIGTIIYQTDIVHP